MSLPDLYFRERMSGPLALGVMDPLEGAQRGRNTPFTFRATIEVESMERFLREPQHEALLTARVDYAPLGRDIPVEHGRFNLFTATDDPRVRLMSYSLPFDSGDRKYFLAGTKTVKDDPGLDLWEDTTQLYCLLHEGEDEQGPVVGAGMVSLGVMDLVALVASMRSCRPGREGMEMLMRFGRFFLGTLWEVYGPRAAAGATVSP